MKLKQGIIISEVNGEFVAVPSGDASKNFNGMIRMNRTAAFIAKMLQIGAGEQEIISALLSEYDVDEEIAREDFVAVLSQFDKLKLLDHE